MRAVPSRYGRINGIAVRRSADRRIVRPGAAAQNVFVALRPFKVGSAVQRHVSVLYSVNTTTGAIENTYNATAAAAAAGVNLVTSFSSKSELAINFSTNGSSLTFTDYNSTVGQFDVSNANTPGIIQPGNTDTATATYRAVAQVNQSGAIGVTTTDVYDGNNPRAVILDNATGKYYLAGNAGKGSNGFNMVYDVGPLSSLPASTPNTISILPGFSTTLAKATPSAANPVYHPFGLFFANSTTLYVADEGSGSTSDFSTTPYEAGGL
jgi:hypothetical protein